MAEQIDNGKTSAAASFEGGIEDACDICCICLDNFSQVGASTITSCDHQYHLQCILEWCQRSSDCPTCRCKISLKEPKSQELLEVVENEKKLRADALTNATTETQTEDRVLRFMVSMGRRYQFSVRVDQSRSSSLIGRSQLVIYSSPTALPFRATSSVVGHANEPARFSEENILTSFAENATDPILDQRNPYGESSVGDHGRSGPSEVQAFSESLSSLSMRYKDSILRSTRSWKERLLAHSNSMADLAYSMMELIDNRGEIGCGFSCMPVNVADWLSGEWRNPY